MTTAGSRLRQIGWLVVIATCLGLFLALSFRVHAVKSEVRLAERQIIALKNETLMLETEFQARANQRQLANWNAVEFGYEAPRADQYHGQRLRGRPLQARARALPSRHGRPRQPRPRDA